MDFWNIERYIMFAKLIMSRNTCPSSDEEFEISADEFIVNVSSIKILNPCAVGDYVSYTLSLNGYTYSIKSEDAEKLIKEFA